MRIAARPEHALPILIIGILVTGFGPILVRLSEIGPVGSAFWRMALPLPIFFVALVAARERARLGPSDWRNLAIAGLMFAADLGAWHWGINLTRIVNATLFGNMSPIFVSLLGWAMMGVRPTPLFAVGLVVTMAGSLALSLGQVSIGYSTLLGDGLSLLAGLFYAVYFVTVAKLRGRLTTIQVMTWSSAVAAVLLLPLALATEASIMPGTTYGWLVLIGLAACGQLGQVAIAFALAHLPAAFSSLAGQFQPFFVGFLGWLVLGEVLPPEKILVGVVVLLGVWIARKGTPRSAA